MNTRVLPSNAVNEMLKNIPNDALRKKYTEIATRRLVKQIRCMSEVCNGAVVGFIDDKNHVTAQTNSDESGLRRHRWRLDGMLGVLCRCGNDSSLAEQEEGIIGARSITRADLEAVARNLASSPARYDEERDGSVEVAGFRIEPIQEQAS